MVSVFKVINRHKLLFWGMLAGITFAIALQVGTIARAELSGESDLRVPLAQVHPLPATLNQWNDPNGAGDYVTQVRSLKVGALIWSHWPVQVAIAPLPEGTLMKPEVWQGAIAQAVEDWQTYLPLTLADSAKKADILISANPPTSRSGTRVRSAETRYELYVSDHQTLAHRINIYIRPNQSAAYITASARHELGHGLGIWGHSPTETDVMYFSQVRHPPSISARDLNTLKRIYQQPTSLGWPLVKG